MWNSGERFLREVSVEDYYLTNPLGTESSKFFWGDSNKFWINGPAGSGKSTLSVFSSKYNSLFELTLLK